MRTLWAAQKPDRSISSQILTALLATVMIHAEAPPASPGEDSLPTPRLVVKVTTPLTYRNTPLDPEIDFAAWIRQSGKPGRLDPNSIRVVNRATGQQVPHALSDDFAYGDRGRVQFVIVEPHHTAFEIRFQIADQRPPLVPREFTPAIGVGDLLRYNSGRPEPIALFHSMGLHDVTGDGRADLVGTWNYFYRPGSPSGGVVFYPAADNFRSLLFGDLRRLRHQPNAEGEPQHFSQHYNACDFADFNQDGRLDFVYTHSGGKRATFYLGANQRLTGGGPVFVAADSVTAPGFYPCRAVDLDANGAIDLVIDGHYIRNVGTGWPFEAAEPVTLDAGVGACFSDLDDDGRPDSICLTNSPVGSGAPLAWRRNLGGTPPRFAAERDIPGIDVNDCTMVAAASWASEQLLLVQKNFQRIEVFAKTHSHPPRFAHRGRAASTSAVLSLSDQAWPCLCDWDDDGDFDLLVGGGYGWPRIVLNRGTRRRPVFAPPQRILAAGQPIRLLRNDLLGPPANWHNMGYPYPDFVDFDNDGRRDLMLPNETNRIFWYRNVGTTQQPRFTKRQQIICDGYPDSPEMRAQSQQRANAPDSNNGVYPLEADRPFFWRTGVAFADFNGDGLMDLVTMDGLRRQATLFIQYRRGESLRLRRDRTLQLEDGRPIDDRIVRRANSWGESLRAVDWDRDGRIDLLYSVAGSHHGTRDGGSIYLLRNVGTAMDPVFAEPQTLSCFGEPIRITNHGPHPWPGDFDGDGQPDLIACVEWSVYPYYSHAALMMEQRPKFTLQLVP